jgi:hypothetical protein
MWIDILHRLRDTVRKKRFGKLKTSSLFLLHDNASAHRSVLVKDFLTKKNVTTMEHPPLSWLQLIFTCFLDCNQHWRDGTFVVLLTYDGKAEKVFTKWLSGMFPTPLQQMAEVYCYTRGLFWWKCVLNCTAFYALPDVKLFGSKHIGVSLF